MKIYIKETLTPVAFTGTGTSETLTPADTPHWRKVRISGSDVWVNLNAANVHKTSDADFPPWQGWQLIVDDDDNSRCDAQDIIKLITDSDKSGKISKSEAQTALQDQGSAMTPQQAQQLAAAAKVQKKLRKTICKFISEWSKADIDKQWGWLKDKARADPSIYLSPTEDKANHVSDDYTPFKKHVEALAIDFNKLGIPAKHWHFHPREFIKQFRKCGWLSEGELARIYPDSAYAAVSKTPSVVKETYRSALNQLFRKYSLNTPNRMSHFFGQAAQESYYFMLTRECAIGIQNAIRNNHISVQPETSGYLQITPANQNQLRYFAAPGQGGYYEGRLNLGNTDTGDGMKFRGRGMKQLTGRYNYSEYWVFRGWLDRNSYDHLWFSRKPNPAPGPVILNPEITADDTYNAVDTAGFYCVSHHIPRAADNGVSKADSAAVSRLVNPGERPPAATRATETTNSYKVLGDEI